MAISICDADGGAQAFLRMDGTLPISTELATNKAYTAAAIRIPTHQLGDLSQPGAPLYSIQNGHQGRIVIFGGGFPLSLDGKVVGGIGISGGSVAEDMSIAQPALQLLAAMENRAANLTELSQLDIPASALPRLTRALQLAFASTSIERADMDTIIGGVVLALS